MNRVQELYKIIEDANKELEDIRKNCEHLKHSLCNYMWAPGHILVGHVCDYCGHYLGKYQTFKKWTDSLADYIGCVYGKINVIDGITTATKYKHLTEKSDEKN